MSTVEVCPDCDIAGCTHIRNRTGAFAALSQPSVTVEELVSIIEQTTMAIPTPDNEAEDIAQAILANYHMSKKRKP